jgi:Helix-turn-helix
MTSKSRAGGKEGKTKEKKPEDPFRQAFATTLRKWRILKNRLPQEELSRKAGLPDYVVGSIERCQRAFSMEEIIRICHALGVGYQEFLDDVYLLLQSAAKAVAEGLRVDNESEERRRFEEELFKTADLVGEVARETFVTAALKVYRRR